MNDLRSGSVPVQGYAGIRGLLQMKTITSLDTSVKPIGAPRGLARYKQLAKNHQAAGSGGGRFGYRSAGTSQDGRA
jgi:hypothetical protein